MYDQLILIRLQQAYEITGDSKTNFWQKQKDGLLISTFKMGLRGAGVFKHELDTIMLARSAGYDDEQIKKLVIKLESKRKDLLDGLLAQLDNIAA